MTEDCKKLLAENFARLEENLKKYEKDGKKPLVVAATKTVDAETINYAAENLGLTDIGENRVQELLSKYDALDKDRLNIHFIGNLQKNKVKYIVGKVCLIHSLDSYELAREIEKQSAKLGIVSDVLVEVNIGAEENKSGADASQIEEIVEKVSKLEHVRLRGMMTIGPKCQSFDEYREYKLVRADGYSAEVSRIKEQYFVNAVIPLSSPCKRLICFYPEDESNAHRTIAFILETEDGVYYADDLLNDGGTGTEYFGFRGCKYYVSGAMKYDALPQ